MLLLHHLRRRSQFLAHQPVCCGDNQHFLCDQVRNKEECFRSCPVRKFTPSFIGHINHFHRLIPIVDEQDDNWAIVDGRQAVRTNIAKTIYGYTRWCWVFLALASLVLQATRTVEVSGTHELLMYYGELGITFAFDIEIVLRVLATLPDWRSFFIHGNNWLDTILAIGSSIIQIPAIQTSSVYPWFTIFQLARFYRVILEVPHMRPLLVRVETCGYLYSS